MTLFTKFVELNPSVNYVFNIIVVVVVGTVTLVNHQTKVSEGFDTNWCHKSLKKAHTIPQFISRRPHFFFITNLSKIKILFQIKKSVNKIQLTHISTKELNFLVVRSTSLNILIIVVVRWFPSNKSSNFLLDFSYNLLIL